MTFEDIEGYAFGLFAVLTILGSFHLLSRLFGRLRSSKAGQTVATQMSNAIRPPAVFPFAFVEIEGQNAMVAFEAAKAKGGPIPILINGGEAVRNGLAEMMKYRKSTEHYLKSAAANPNPFAFKSKPRMPGQWVESGPFSDDGQPFLIKKLPSGFQPVVTLASIPAASSADIPAYLRLGGWNGIAEADVWVALFRNWQRDYGAELVAVSLDAVDIRVSRKPEAREQALLLAREHKKFCDSGATLAESAAELMQTNWWHFYWD